MWPLTSSHSFCSLSPASQVLRLILYFLTPYFHYKAQITPVTFPWQSGSITTNQCIIRVTHQSVDLLAAGSLDLMLVFNLNGFSVITSCFHTEIVRHGVTKEGTRIATPIYSVQNKGGKKVQQKPRYKSSFKAHEEAFYFNCQWQYIGCHFQDFLERQKGNSTCCFSLCFCGRHDSQWRLISKLNSTGGSQVSHLWPWESHAKFSADQLVIFSDYAK